LEGARGATAREAFGQRLVALLPELRKHAVFLARDRAAAEDLVQGAAANAMAAWERFEPGTNFAGWMHRILRNLFL
jgi:RNA polymerase sigma-70 factor, ECF subfamily